MQDVLLLGKERDRGDLLQERDAKMADLASEVSQVKVAFGRLISRCKALNGTTSRLWSGSQRKPKSARRGADQPRGGVPTGVAGGMNSSKERQKLEEAAEEAEDREVKLEWIASRRWAG